MPHLPKTQEQSKAVVYLLVGVVVIVLAIILFNKILRFGSGTLEAIGLKDTKEERANAGVIKSAVNRENAKGSKSYWSPNFYKIIKAPNRLTTSFAESVAKQFYDSVGYVWDTPSEGAAALRRLQNGAQLSQVAEAFNKKYSLDLLNWLQNKYDTAEQREIFADMLRYANNLDKWN